MKNKNRLEDMTKEQLINLFKLMAKASMVIQEILFEGSKQVSKNNAEAYKVFMNSQVGLINYDAQYVPFTFETQEDRDEYIKYISMVTNLMYQQGHLPFKMDVEYFNHKSDQIIEIIK